MHFLNSNFPMCTIGILEREIRLNKDFSRHKCIIFASIFHPEILIILKKHILTTYTEKHEKLNFEKKIGVFFTINVIFYSFYFKLPVTSKLRQTSQRDQRSMKVEDYDFIWYFKHFCT